jgi:hypothetical protein
MMNSGAISDVALIKLAEGLGPITSIANAGDSRLFLTLRGGRIVIWNETGMPDSPFLDLTGLVSVGGSRGLLSMAFDPDYASNGFFFVAYTDKASNLVIARYSRASAQRDSADPATGVELLKIPFPPDSGYYGGALQFGPDGFLYAGIGDGGSTASHSDNAQRDDVLLGKIIRLDVDTNAASPPYYAIPPSNPFAGPGPPLDEIWAKGLRDPWRFSFDRETGDLYIGDVGPSSRQKIAVQPYASAGGEDYELAAQAPESSSSRPASLPYGSSQVPGCAVAGGYVYRGSRDPRLDGTYFYGDYCTGFIWGRGQVTNVVAPNLTTFGEDSTGELYVGTGTGALYRITSTQPPPASAPESVSLIAEERSEARNDDFLMGTVPAVFDFSSISESEPGASAPPAVENEAPIDLSPPEYVPPYLEDSAAPAEQMQPPEQPPPPAATPPPPAPEPDRSTPTRLMVDEPPPRVIERPATPAVEPPARVAERTAPQVVERHP